MLNEPMNGRQAIAVLMMFSFGSSVVMGVNTGAGQDSWLALLLAMAFTMPVVLMYARIMELNPRMDIFQVLEARLGKIAGKVAVALMTWYALHLSALVLRNFSEFIQVSSLLETPQLPVMVVMIMTICYLAKGGGKALGKWAIATLPVVALIVSLTISLSLNVMRFDNLLPIFGHPFGKIAESAFMIFSFPLCETVLFLGVADVVGPNESPRKIYLLGTLCSALVLLLILLRNLFVLGAEVISTEYFPSYVAARIINLGDFISRIEGSISINFILAGITKIALCIIAASKGMARLFSLGDGKGLVVPVGLLSLALAVIVYNNAMQMFEFVQFYSVYAMPFQVFVPGVAWLFSEVRARRARAAA